MAWMPISSSPSFPMNFIILSIRICNNPTRLPIPHRPICSLYKQSVISNMKILVPTDFSENAAQAFEFAKKLALLNGGKITLFFAYFTVYDFAAQDDKIIDQIETSANKAMEEIYRDQKEGILVDHKIVHGAVSSAITSTAYRGNYDLIVMGTQGASG